MPLTILPVLDAAAARRAQPVLEACSAHDHEGLPADPVEELVARLDGPERAERVLVFALTSPPGTPSPGMPSPGTGDDAVVAVGRLGLPLLDNTSTGSFELHVHPDHRRRGFGAQLARSCLGVARSQGRTRLLLEVCTPLEGTSPAAAFAASLGARPVLGEVRRVLDLAALRDSHVQARRAEAEQAAAGYRVEQWIDSAPGELVDDLARLSGRMSTDTPMGEMDWEPEAWDAERWLAKEADAALAHRARACSAVVHEATGRTVGYTDIGVSRLRPDVGYQWDTIVEPEHRGHRLGMLLKAANLQLLRRELSAVRLVNTWNAEVNVHMVAVNDALGFRPVERWTEWQLEL